MTWKHKITTQKIAVVLSDKSQYHKQQWTESAVFLNVAGSNCHSNATITKQSTKTSERGKKKKIKI